MSQIINLLVGLYALYNVLYSFVGNPATGSIFGYEMNIWLYRLIWAIFAGVILFGFYTKRKKAINN